MKKISLIIFCFISAFIIHIYLNNSNLSKYIVTSNKEEKKFSSTISMMYETSEGSGEYIESLDSSWPQDGYTFNSILSKCDNGGTLTWDETNKKVLMSSSVSDKCYVYFDLKPATFSAYIKSLYGVDKAILYHDENLVGGAEDYSYRYSGSNDIVNNYVCFGSTATTCPEANLYRIIGVFEDKIKLIKATSYGKFHVSVGFALFNSSDAYKELNVNFYNSLSSKWQNVISTESWVYSPIDYRNVLSLSFKKNYNIEFLAPGGSSGTASWKTAKQWYNAEKNADHSIVAKFALPSISEFRYSADINNWSVETYDTNSWIFSGLSENTYIFYELSISELSSNYVITNTGNLIYDYEYSNPQYIIRPVFYLDSLVKLASGTGTQNDPYRIEI